MNKETLRKYFSENLARKLAALVLLLSFSANIFAEAVPDPVSIGNARATRTASGIEQLDIATPNAKGLSYNSLLELQVSEQGLILNNNPHVVADTQIAGLVARNRNLDRSGSANLIVTEITGKNRTNINGYVEVAGDRADIVMANRNGITVNGGGFLNSGRVTLTSGKLNMADGELKSIDVESGNVRIGEKGIDALSLTDLELVAKTVDIDGIIKGSTDTKVRISAGGQTYEYRTKEVTSKGKTYSGIAVDGKSAGSMYAGKIDIISNDKGAGVNTKGDLVSIDDVTITASGDVTTHKVHSEKRVVYRTPKKVRITKQVTAGEKVVVRAKKTEVDVNAQVITGYLKKSLGEDAFEAKSDEVNIYGKIEANGKVLIDGKAVRNAGEISATDKVTVNGQTLDNTKGEIRSDGKVELNTQSTVNRQGYILSDGLTKEDVVKSTENLESSQNAERLGNTSEAGVSISGDLDNTKGVVKGREVSIGGSLNGNREGLVRSMGDLSVNGSIVDNAGGRLEGRIKDINAKKVINDNGAILSGKGLSIISDDIGNRNGVIYADGDVKLVGSRIDNFSGIVKGTGNLEISSGSLDNRQGDIVSEDDVKISSDRIDNRSGNIQGKGKMEIDSKSLDNRKGDISSGNGTVIRSDRIDNIMGNIQSAGNIMIKSGNLDTREGNIVSNGAVKIDSDKIDNRKGSILGSGKVDVVSGDVNNREGSILSEDDIEIRSDKIDNIFGKVKGNGKIEAKSKDLNNRDGEITGIEDVNIESTKLNNDGGKISSLNSGVSVKSDDAGNVKGIIEGLTRASVNAGHIRNAGGKIVSEGTVELSTPNEYTYEGTVEGKVLTSINGGKITVNDRIERSGALELIAQNGMTLNNDVTARILNIQAGADLENSHSLKGNEYLSVRARNISNGGQMLSDEYVHVKADGRLANGPSGRIASNGDIFLEAQSIENNRGNILANGTLTMIADSLIRNDLGRIHSGTGTYGVVRNGRFENIGRSNVEIIENVNSSLGISGVQTRTGRFRARSPRVQNVLNDRPTYSMNASSESSDITSDGFIALDVNGDVVNRDAGKIEAKGITQIKANNVYNISRMAASRDGNTVLVGAGGRITGSEVYLDVAGKVVNGVEDSLGNAYRREDGVLVDNRNVVSVDQSVIAGTNETAVKAGSVINTAQIGEKGKGATFIETQGTVSNNAMGGNAAKIEGSTVAIDGKAGVTNTGSIIEGTKGTQVVSSNGQVINESTVQSETVYKNTDTGRRGFLRLLTETTPQIDRVTESIRNVGKIESSGGLVYVEGDRGVINVAGNLRGSEGTYLVGKNGTIEDRTISLKDLRHNVVETRTEKREVRKPGLGRSKGAARTEDVQVQTRWDIVDRTDTVSGIIGMGKNTVLEGKDIVLASSDLRGTEDIVLNAKNYILMLSTVNSEYKSRTETHKSGRVRKKVKTQNWTEDNEYTNNVDITTEGNILLNYHGAGAPADNKGIFAQGVNFNAKGQVLGYSEGDIYIQGTKDRLNSVYTSKTKKSFAGIGYGKSSDYVNTYQERYRLGQLYGDAGITYDADGKLRVEGVDIQSSGKIFLRGKKGLELMAGTENSYRYEEHKSSGFTAKFGKGSVFIGVERKRDELDAYTSRTVGNIINANGEGITLAGNTIVSIGNKFNAGTSGITLISKNGIVTADGRDISIMNQSSETSRAGLYANANGKRLSASAGLEAAYAANLGSQVVANPNRNVFVTDGEISMYTENGNIVLQGDFGSRDNVTVYAPNGKVYIKDSVREVSTDIKDINARAAFGVGIDAGGIKDTLKSYRNYFKTVWDVLRDPEDLIRAGSVVRDLVRGKSLMESLEGKENAVNMVNTIFKGPSSGGVTATGGLEARFSSAKESSKYIQNITTNVRSGKDVILKGQGIDINGGFVRGENDVFLDAKDINVTASKNTYSASNKSKGINLGISRIGSESETMGLSYGNGTAEGTSYINSSVQAGNTLILKGDNMTVKGGLLKGKHTVIDLKNLVIESLQDKEKISQVGVNANLGVVHGTSAETQGKNVTISPDTRLNGTIGGNYVKGDKLWVNGQSGIIGSESVRGNVSEKTTLIGGIIANITKEGKDGGNLVFSTGSLETRDLHNYDNYGSYSGSIGISERAESQKTELVINKNKKNGQVQEEDVKYVPNRVDEVYTFGVQGHEREKATRATIGKGALTVGKGLDTVNINRDIERAEELTHNVGVVPVSYTFNSEPASWGDFSKIISSDAGIIGDFIDDMNEKVFKGESKNFEGKFASTTYKVISKIERPVSKYAGRFTSLVPTEATHGGILEQIVRTIRKDKTPIVEIAVSKGKDGKSNVEMTEIEKISDNSIKNGKVRIGTNGIIELQEQAARNIIFKNWTEEDTKAYNNGETVKFIMVYNKTRGAFADILESALGKFADGSASSLGLSIGVNRGAAIAYASRNKNQQNEMTFYSQGNIIGLGGFNILRNNGVQLGTAENKVGIRMYGSPITVKAFNEVGSKIGVYVIGSAINYTDIIGNEGELLGLSGERRRILGTTNLEDLKSKWKDSDLVANSPVIKALFREEPGAVLPLPVKVSEEEKKAYEAKDEAGKLEWLRKHNYSMPVTEKDLQAIQENYKIEANGNKISYDTIMNKMLNDGHGSYTYYSAIYANQIDKLLEDYQKLPVKTEMDKYNLEMAIVDRYIKSQQSLIDLFANGPAIGNESAGLMKGLENYNESHAKDYQNKNNGISQEHRTNYVMRYMIPHIQNGELSGLDISNYIDVLRNGVGVR